MSYAFAFGFMVAAPGRPVPAALPSFAMTLFDTPENAASDFVSGTIGEIVPLPNFAMTLFDTAEDAGADFISGTISEAGGGGGGGGVTMGAFDAGGVWNDAGVWNDEGVWP